MSESVGVEVGEEGSRASCRSRRERDLARRVEMQVRKVWRSGSWTILVAIVRLARWMRVSGGYV